jgi:hypothetical protein
MLRSTQFWDVPAKPAKCALEPGVISCEPEPLYCAVLGCWRASAPPAATSAPKAPCSRGELFWAPDALAAPEPAAVAAAGTSAPKAPCSRGEHFWAPDALAAPELAAVAAVAAAGGGAGGALRRALVVCVDWALAVSCSVVSVLNLALWRALPMGLCLVPLRPCTCAAL